MGPTRIIIQDAGPLDLPEIFDRGSHEAVLRCLA